MKASSGVWYVPKSLKLSTNDTRFLDIKNLRIFGETSKSIATIENSILAKNKIEVFISNIERLFNSGENVRIVDSNNQDVIINGSNLRAKIVGQISQVNVAKDIFGNLLRGNNYNTGDPVVIYGGLNTEVANPVGATAEVGQTTTGSVQRINVLTGGFGYNLYPNTIIDFTSTEEMEVTPTAKVGSIDPSPGNTANVTYLPQDIISYKNTIQIGNSNYYFANGYTLTVNTSLYSVNANTFKLGETVYQGPSANPTFSGTVSRWDSANGILKFSYAAGQPKSNANVISVLTGNVGNVRVYSTANANTKLAEAISFYSFLSGLNDEVNAVVIPPSLMGVFNDPHLDHSNTVIQYISDTYGNANTVMATVEASNFDPTKVQWA